MKIPPYNINLIKTIDNVYTKNNIDSVIIQKVPCLASCCWTGMRKLKKREPTMFWSPNTAWSFCQKNPPVLESLTDINTDWTQTKYTLFLIHWKQLNNI